MAKKNKNTNSFLKSNLTKFFFKVIIFVCSLVFGVYLIVIALVWLYSSKTYNGAADAVLVFGAAEWNGKPSPVLRERLNHAINIFKQKRVKYIILTGGYGRNSEFSEAVVSAEYCMRNGIKKENIIIENISNSTIENIYYAKKKARNYKIKSYIFVSDPMHLLRAVILADYFDITAYPSPTPTSKIKNLPDKLKFAAAEAYFVIKIFVYSKVMKTNIIEL